MPSVMIRVMKPASTATCCGTAHRPARLARAAALFAGLLAGLLACRPDPCRAVDEARIDDVVTKGLDWLVRQQSRRGSWTANDSRYPTAMTALAGTAMLMEGSTTTQGRYADAIRQAVNYLVNVSRPNGLIGDPKNDDRYTYGHGFSMLFLSQVLGE